MTTKNQETTEDPKPKKTTEKKVQLPKTIWDSLFAFQQEQITVPKTGVSIGSNGEEYNHHVLEDVINTIRPLMTKHRLAYSQVIDEEYLATVVMALDAVGGKEDRIISKIHLGQASSTQEFGARVTVARRYALLSILGLSGEDDNDNARVSKIVNQTEPYSSRSEEGKKREEADPTWSDAHKTAWNTINACKNKEALSLIAGQVSASVKLTDSEKQLLSEFIQTKSL